MLDVEICISVCACVCVHTPHTHGIKYKTCSIKGLLVYDFITEYYNYIYILDVTKKMGIRNQNKNSIQKF